MYCTHLSYPEGDVDNTPLSEPRSGAGGRDREAASASRPLGAIAWPPSGTGNGHGKPAGGVLSTGTRLHRAGANAHGRLSFGNRRTRYDSIVYFVGVQSRVREAATGRS